MPEGSSLALSGRLKEKSTYMSCFLASSAAGGALISFPADGCGKSWIVALFVQSTVLTPTHRCQRYSEYRASCLQATAAPALFGFTLLDCLISQEGRKWLSYPAANLRFIKGESHKKKSKCSFLLTQQVARVRFGPNQSFFLCHQSVLGLISANSQRQCNRNIKHYRFDSVAY